MIIASIAAVWLVINIAWAVALYIKPVHRCEHRPILFKEFSEADRA